MSLITREKISLNPTYVQVLSKFYQDRVEVFLNLRQK